MKDNKQAFKKLQTKNNLNKSFWTNVMTLIFFLMTIIFKKKPRVGSELSIQIRILQY